MRVKLKTEPIALALRLVTALFLFSLVLAALFLTGTAQSFSDVSLRRLYGALRWVSWVGLIVTWLGLFPWSWKKTSRVLASVTLGAGFAALFVFVLVWGSWVYPDLGVFPW